MESRLYGGDVFLNKLVGDEDDNDSMLIFSDNSVNLQELTENYYDSKVKFDCLHKAF